MHLFELLFGRRKRPDVAAVPAAPSPRSRPLIAFEHGMAQIDSLDFFGQYAKSPSGEYVLCWCDFDKASGRGGSRDSGLGTYMLYNALADAILLRGHLERPNDGSVADSGVFCLEDWHFTGDLSGTFCVFAPSGKKLIQRRFDANLFNCAISPDGRYAVCQTAENRKSEDGNRLTFFDVEHGAELYNLHPTTGWAKAYAFDENTGALTVVIEGLGRFRYDTTGTFIDAANFDLACLRCGQFERVLTAAEEMLRRPSLDAQLVHSILASAKGLCATSSAVEGNRMAAAWKIQGRVHEFLGDDVNALAAFDAALKIDPNIGVKRKADALRKKMARPSN
jgi:hypothetical protein